MEKNTNSIAKSSAAEFPMFHHLLSWLSVPFCVTVSWVFHTMQRIGHVGENPFEGTPNDVPISTIARGIEIDLRQLSGEKLEDIPKPYPQYKNVQM